MGDFGVKKKQLWEHHMEEHHSILPVQFQRLVGVLKLFLVDHSDYHTGHLTTTLRLVYPLIGHLSVL